MERGTVSHGREEWCLKGESDGGTEQSQRESGEEHGAVVGPTEAGAGYGEAQARGGRFLGKGLAVAPGHTSGIALPRRGRVLRRYLSKEQCFSFISLEAFYCLNFALVIQRGLSQLCDLGFHGSGFGP